jgi:hypothetical protein
MSINMKRLPFLLLCIIFQLLGTIVEALNAAGGAETTFFYQAYLLERAHVKDPSRRLIAPDCATYKGKAECSFADFVDYISAQKARTQNEKNWDVIRKIFDEAGNTLLAETCKKLREAGFEAQYDQSRLYPKEVLNPSVSLSIRGMRNIAMTTKTNAYQDQKKKMIEALELEREIRQADNMRFFIPKLEAKLGITLETKNAMTSDGIAYTMYDETETAKKNTGIENLAQKINKAAEALRKTTRNDGKDFIFATHQAVIREASNSITELKKKCPS